MLCEPEKCYPAGYGVRKNSSGCARRTDESTVGDVPGCVECRVLLYMNNQKLSDLPIDVLHQILETVWHHD
jgi:hypothetical protein